MKRNQQAKFMIRSDLQRGFKEQGEDKTLNHKQNFEQ